MKKILLIAVASMTFVFSSCSSEETAILETENPQLLKSFKVKKDALGKYYVDYDLANDARIDKVYDPSTGSNQIFLYSTNQVTEKRLSEEFSLNNSLLKIDFVDTNMDNSPSITITDDNIAFSKGKSNALDSYDISGNLDGTYKLDFSVANNVVVDFVYNEDINTYEIHLENGKTDQTQFNMNFNKDEGEPLRIDFVNHFGNNSSKSGEQEAGERKPKVIVN